MRRAAYHFWMVLAWTGVLAFCSSSLAQEASPEPPLRLKKKTRIEAEPPGKLAPAEARPPDKARAEKEEKAAPGDDESMPPEPDENEKEMLERIFRNVRTAEERLARLQLNEGTRQVQQDILKDLESLIALTRRQQSSPQNADSSSDPSASSSQAQGSQQRQARGSRRGSRRQPGEGQRLGTRQGRGQGRGQQQPEQVAGDTGQQPGSGGSKEKEQAPGRMAEVFKDVWGHLPETLRAEMDAYARDHFMFKYRPVIERYYSAIAEQSRRQRD